MSNERIEPSKIRTPIQLLAAWLVGLIAVNGSFLTAAATLVRPTWAAAALTVASILNVPIFLAAIFLLQTRFRPEMQEDEYYSKYLENQYSALTGKTEISEVKIPEVAPVTFKKVVERTRFQRPPRPARVAPRPTAIAINDLLPHYSEIIQELGKLNLHPTSTFGSTSFEPKPPRPFIIAIGLHVDVSVLQAVIKVTMKFGLNGVGRALTDMDFGRIYIGAYSYDDGTRSFLSVDDKVIKKLLSPTLTEDDLYSYLSENIDR